MDDKSELYLRKCDIETYYTDKRYYLVYLAILYSLSFRTCDILGRVMTNVHLEKRLLSPKGIHSSFASSISTFPLPSNQMRFNKEIAQINSMVVDKTYS